MWYAFHTSDYYDSPVPHVPLQPQLAQPFDRNMEFPRSQSALLRLDLDSHYTPVQGGRSYAFVPPSFHSSRPRQKCLAYTPVARGIRIDTYCFSSFYTDHKDYLLPTSHIAALRCSLILRLQTWIHPRTTSDWPYPTIG